MNDYCCFPTRLKPKLGLISSICKRVGLLNLSTRSFYHLRSHFCSFVSNLFIKRIKSSCFSITVLTSSAVSIFSNPLRASFNILAVRCETIAFGKFQAMATCQSDKFSDSLLVLTVFIMLNMLACRSVSSFCFYLLCLTRGNSTGPS
jgi:hypothetical protein